MKDTDILISAGDVTLQGILHPPTVGHGLVVFAHGSGSSRKSPRNTQVARFLQGKGLGTLLFDLLTEAEEEEDAVTLKYRFDISLLAERLEATTDFLLENPVTSQWIQGYFGSSTGAAAALQAAARKPHAIGAIVSRGGRPDLALPYVEDVRCPTLFLVGGKDFQVLDLHQEVLEKMGGLAELVVVPHATHLFEETGTLDEVCRHAAKWFGQHLSACPSKSHFPE